MQPVYLALKQQTVEESPFFGKQLDQLPGQQLEKLLGQLFGQLLEQLLGKQVKILFLF